MISIKSVGVSRSYPALFSWAPGAEQVALRQNTKFRLWRRQFELFEDKQGLLRCGGRLSNAGIPCETANPIFLEKRSYLTHLIVKDCHERMKHGGVSSTLAELRSKYCLGSARSTVNQASHLSLHTLSAVSRQVI